MGPPAWLFWSLPGRCQILAFPRTSPSGLGGSPGPHFLPGDINQLSNSPEASTEGLQAEILRFSGAWLHLDFGKLAHASAPLTFK